jgi:Recombinase/Recombinase zinc beta ribbon domain
VSAPAGARAIVGVRVSAVGEWDAETATSAPDQRAWGQRRAELAGWPIVGTAEDLSVPGDAWAERAGLWAGVEAIERGDAEVLLYQNTKRFARDPELGFHVLGRIERAGGWLVLGDCPDGAPAAMLGLMLGQGKDDHDEKKAYIRVAKKRALDRGDYMSGRAPVGYVFNRDAGELREPDAAPRKLIPSADADAVRELFRMSAAGVGSVTLAAHLKARTGRAYYPASMFSLLRNRAYRGEVRFGAVVIPDAHAAIVSEEEWLAAQRVRSPRLKKSGTKSLLAGIARCASCGRKMGADFSRGGGIYKCPRTPVGSCAAPASIKIADLDRYVLNAVDKWAEASGEADRPHAVEMADEIAAARAIERDAEEDLETWAIDSAGLPRPAVQKGLQARQERLQEARERRQGLEAVSASASARTTYRELAGTMDVAETRHLLGSIIERVAVTRGTRFHKIPLSERVRIVWIEDDAGGGGERTPAQDLI